MQGTASAVAQQRGRTDAAAVLENHDGESAYALYRHRKKKEYEDQAASECDEFTLPIDHRITEPLDRSSLVQSTMDTPLSSENKGFKMLLKMGWKQDAGLGMKQTANAHTAITEPIRLDTQDDRLGLGKRQREEEVAEIATSKRRALNIELTETEELAAKRKAEAEKSKAREEEFAAAHAELFCKVCNKQYTKATEMEVHLSSYDHGHKKRLLEMKQMEREKHADEKAERERRQREREEQELHRRAAAAAVAAGGDAPSGNGQTTPAAESKIELGASRPALSFGFGQMGKKKKKGGMMKRR